MSEESKNIVETVKETAEKAVETVKETVTETVKETIETGKDTAEKVVETVKETVTETVETITEPVVTKKATWWNRIWSAIVGAIIAVGAMFGITTDQVAEQKAKVEEVKNIAAETLENIKAGNLEDAKAGLQLIIESGKEVAEQAKTDVETVTEQVKNTPAEEIAAEAVKGAVSAVKNSNEQK